MSGQGQIRTGEGFPAKKRYAISFGAFRPLQFPFFAYGALPASSEDNVCENRFGIERTGPPAGVAIRSLYIWISDTVSKRLDVTTLIRRKDDTRATFDTCPGATPRVSIFSHNSPIYRRERLFVPVKCPRSLVRALACDFAPSPEK